MEAARKPRVAVLISGSGSNLQALLDAAQSPDYPAEIALVISNKQDAFGMVRALKAGVPALCIPHADYPTREAFEAALQEQLHAAAIDYVCLAGFMRVLTANFVQAWHGRMLNIHPSLLPAFAGLHTHQRALESGARFAGCSVHFVVPEMDAGPIVAQATVPVLPDDTAEALAGRVLVQEHALYPQCLAWLVLGQLHVVGNRVQTPAAPPQSTRY